MLRWLVLPLLFAGAARAETFTPDDFGEIGTQVGAIATRVDGVTAGLPVRVEVDGVGPVWEITGTVSGVGWGGMNLTAPGLGAGAHRAHYTYTVTWLARWPVGRGATAVVYHHGGDTPLLAALQADLASGAANPNRTAERLGEESAGRPVLLRGGTFLAWNRRGLLPDGSFAARFDPEEVAPLSAADVARACRAIRRLPADAPTCESPHPQLQPGLPVPASPPIDSVTARDVDRAILWAAALRRGRPFRERIATGVSAGAVAMGGMAFGCSAVVGDCVRTGGNHTVPYDARSPKIFDGFVFSGYVYDRANRHVSDEQPLSGKVFFLQGRGDERYQQTIHLMYDLLVARVPLDGNVWLYEIANMPHVTRDNPSVVLPPNDQAEPLGPYLGAAIHNMRRLLRGHGAPPPSRIAGRLRDGALVFDVAGGPGFTQEIPVREDLDLDLVEAGPQLVKQTVDAGIYAGNSLWWDRVTRELPHVAGEIIGPTIACRTGRYTLKFQGAQLFPFPDLTPLYPRFKDYKACVKENVKELVDDGLYDARVESAAEVAERSCALFSACR